MNDQKHQPPGGLLSRLLRRGSVGSPSETPDKTPPESPPVVPIQEPTPGERLDLAEVDKQIKRLAKEVYRVNTLTEAQNEQNRLATESLRQLLSQIGQDHDAVAKAAARRARLEAIKALLPVLDAVEAGIFSGVAQIKALLPTAPEAARTLAAWLNGQRLLLDRLNKLLEAEGIRRIPTVGELFDPYKHVTVKTVQDATKAPGIILAEERHGYMVEEEVLRYAEVVVNKP